MVFIIATKKSNGGKEIRRKKKVLEVAGKMFKKKNIPDSTSNSLRSRL